MNIIQQCAIWAREAHRGQYRRFTKQPYKMHVDRVACQVMRFPNATEITVGASFLHDTKEDNPKYWASILDYVPIGAIELVDWLTKEHKNLNMPRKEHDKLNRDKLAIAPYWAKVIKCFDRLDNLSDLDQADDVAFKTRYVEDSKLLIPVIAASSFLDDALWTAVKKVELSLKVERGEYCKECDTIPCYNFMNHLGKEGAEQHCDATDCDGRPLTKNVEVQLLPTTGRFDSFVGLKGRVLELLPANVVRVKLPDGDLPLLGHTLKRIP